MNGAASARSGILGSIHDFADSLFASARNRLSLVSVELQEEKYRLIQLASWISAAIFTGIMTVIMLSITIVYLFWEEARLEALLGVTGFYLIAFLGVVLGFKRYLARQSRPFAGTLAQFKRDRQCLHEGS